MMYSDYTTAANSFIIIAKRNPNLSFLGFFPGQAFGSFNTRFLCDTETEKSLYSETFEIIRETEILIQEYQKSSKSIYKKYSKDRKSVV